MHHGPGVCAGVLTETSLRKVVSSVDDRVDAAVQDGRQVQDVVHNHWNLGNVQFRIRLYSSCGTKFEILKIILYLSGVTVTKCAVNGVPRVIIKISLLKNDPHQVLMTV